jgi:hypothetical protein
MHNRLLPPNWGDMALQGSEEAVASWLTSLMRREFHVAGEDVVLARKLERGARPLSVLGLQERLLYRGAVSLVQHPAATVNARSQEEYETFRQAPLGVAECRYVLKTDIAAYYQYIDHERLIDEVVAQTGDDLAISVATDLLHEATGRTYGLPQLSSVSDVLAEIYIEPMRRTLVRAGFAVSRFADDFRVACRSYEEALTAWEAADSAARELGLVLNESKTSTPGRDRYAASLTAIRDQERELFADLEVEDLGEPEYWDDEGWEDDDDEEEENEGRDQALLADQDFTEGDVATETEDHRIDETTVSQDQLTAARAVLERWLAEQSDDVVRHRETAQITATLLGRALRVLARAEDPGGLDKMTMMLVYEPSLTPTIVRYARRCISTHRDNVVQALDDTCESGVVSAWQAIWVAYLAGELPRRRRRVQNAGHVGHVAWLRDQAKSPNSAVAAEAILALARRNFVTADEVNSVLSRLTTVQRPTGIVALASLGTEALAASGTPSELDRLRAAWAVEHL